MHTRALYNTNRSYVCVSFCIYFSFVSFLRYFLLFLCFVLRSAKTRRQHVASLTRRRLKCNGRAVAAAAMAARRQQTNRKTKYVCIPTCICICVGVGVCVCDEWQLLLGRTASKNKKLSALLLQPWRQPQQQMYYNYNNWYLSLETKRFEHFFYLFIFVCFLIILVSDGWRYRWIWILG